MQTATKIGRQTHWLAGIVAVVVALGLFGAQLTLVEHYSQAAAGTRVTSLAGRKAATAVAQNSGNSALLRTSLQQPIVKQAMERRPAS